MARPRKPTAVLEISGSFKKNPSRKRQRTCEPRSSDPLGPAPACLSGELKIAWNEIAMMAPPGVLRFSDRMICEIASRMICRLRAGKASGAELGVLMRAMASMGLSPADRSRICLGDPVDDLDVDPLDRLEAKLASRRPN